MRPVRIFGYGSLVWRPAFPFTRRRAALVHGHARRFYQGSTDHRGVPGAPGRVVTLLPEPGGRVHGMIYELAPERAEDILALLDVREQLGYERVVVHAAPWPPDVLDVHDEQDMSERAPARVEALTYVATPANSAYLGPAPLPAIARQIARARGPSGSNREYLLRLAAALRRLGADDPHVFALERELAALDP